jgi:hypothetical protein
VEARCVHAELPLCVEKNDPPTHAVANGLNNRDFRHGSEQADGVGVVVEGVKKGAVFPTLFRQSVATGNSL